LVPDIPVGDDWCYLDVRVKLLCVRGKLARAIAFRSPLRASIKFPVVYIALTPVAVNLVTPVYLAAHQLNVDIIPPSRGLSSRPEPSCGLLFMYPLV